MQQPPSPDAPTSTTLSRVLAYIAPLYHCTPADLQGRSRLPHIAHGRQLAMAGLQRAGLRPNEIAQALDRNHSTVLYGLQVVARRAARAEDSFFTDALAMCAFLADREWTPAEQASLLRSMLHRHLDHRLHVPMDAYVLGALTGLQAPWHSLQAAYGLGVLARDDGVRGLVEEALRRVGQGTAIPRLHVHLRQLARCA